MTAGDKRRSRRTARFDSRELARLSGKVNPAAAAWDERAAPPQASDDLPISRTATVDDPLTTSLLAEVARRSKTVEVTPEQIDEVAAIETDDADAPRDRDPSKPSS